MNVSWVLADTFVLDPVLDIKEIKEIGPLWGSWKTWRACQTDNVICHDLIKAGELLKRNFQTNCNFYIPNANWVKLDRPENVHLYEGSFVDEFQPEEIIGMHLASQQSDIVLLLGFDLTEKERNPNKLLEHQAQAYRALVINAIENSDAQWVLVDHSGSIMKKMLHLPNLTTDTMVNCLGLKGL
jgi:hypothetical protein